MDDDPPVINAFTVSNESTTGYLTTTTADFEISVSPDVVAYRLSNDAVFGRILCAKTRRVNPSLPFLSVVGRCFLHRRREANVYLQVADNAGNTASSAVSWHSIPRSHPDRFPSRAGRVMPLDRHRWHTLTYPADTVGFW